MQEGYSWVKSHENGHALGPRNFTSRFQFQSSSTGQIFYLCTNFTEATSTGLTESECSISVHRRLDGREGMKRERMREEH